MLISRRAMTNAAEPEPQHSRLGIVIFLCFLGALFLIRLWFGIASVPVSFAPALNVASAVGFIAIPVLALFNGTSAPWKFPAALITLAFGVLLQVGSGVAINQLHLTGVPQVAVQALGQTGLLTWCLGLGVMVSLMIKERNLVLPVAIFLAGFDAFLVLTPYAPTAAIVEQRPEVFQSVASSVPRARETRPSEAPKEAKLEALAFVGPADFLFAAVFFALLFKFGLRAKETAMWLVPALVLYLLIVLMPWGLGMLPALVPIGGTVLLVNRKEFTLTKDEKQATWGVVMVAVGLAGYGYYQRINYKPKLRPPVAPLQRQASAMPKGPEAMPAPTPSN